MNLTYPVARKPRLELTNMIDVMFFLLVFFMLFTTFRAGQTGIELNLPQASSGKASLARDMVISVTQDGLYCGNEKVTLGTLGARVAERLRTNPEAMVIIEGDKNIRYAQLVAVIDIARQYGGRRVALAVKPLAEKHNPVPSPLPTESP